MDKKTDLLNNTQFKVDDKFGDVIEKGTSNSDRITKFLAFSAKLMWIITLV